MGSAYLMEPTLLPTLQPDVPSRLLDELNSPRFCELAPRHPIEKGRKIGGQGRPCDRLYLIAEGQVLISTRDDEGDELALYLLGPGEVFGIGALLPERRWLVTARAVTDGVVHALPGAHVAKMGQYYPELTTHLFAVLAKRIERFHLRLRVMVRQSARDRLLGLLSLLAGYHGEPEGDNHWLPIPVTQSQLGEMIGLARETVARTLADLEEEGVIRREGRKGFLLVRHACEPTP